MQVYTHFVGPQHLVNQGILLLIMEAPFQLSKLMDKTDGNGRLCTKIPELSRVDYNACHYLASVAVTFPRCSTDQPFSKHLF